MIKTTPYFWDCECKDNYIHYKLLEKVCPHCMTHHEDQPDSRPNEIHSSNISPESKKLIKERIKVLHDCMRTAHSSADRAELNILEDTL